MKVTAEGRWCGGLIGVEHGGLLGALCRTTKLVRTQERPREEAFLFETHRFNITSIADDCRATKLSAYLSHDL